MVERITKKEMEEILKQEFPWFRNEIPHRYHLYVATCYPSSFHRVFKFYIWVDFELEVVYSGREYMDIYLYNPRIRCNSFQDVVDNIKMIISFRQLFDDNCPRDLLKENKECSV